MYGYELCDTCERVALEFFTLLTCAMSSFKPHFSANSLSWSVDGLLHVEAVAEKAGLLVVCLAPAITGAKYAKYMILGTVRAVNELLQRNQVPVFPV